ncbi:head completion/stabilization protein [Microbulbifer sp. TYP-18]|uniref:head completion/stabilization protein n=1 Tax=Microbulbifer sp. TYP-18 TaxID=3230024 RepID=UPI0034C6A522
MNPLVVNVPDSQPTSGEPFGNDGWFPDIDQEHLRDSVRIHGDIPEQRLREACLYAMASVNRELRDWQSQQIESGYSSLAQVPGTQMGGESQLLMLYRRAVYSTVKADLTERYRDHDSTGAGHDRADDLSPGIDEQRRNARWAISAILGLSRSTVELI